jgi:MFS family permease
MGQVVSEIGDHFNNIAVFSLAVQTTHSGLVVSGVLLARAIPAVLAGPLAGVTLDRLNRKHVMIASDLIRAVVALAFILTVKGHSTALLYGLSALLMLASPFFTSGRSSILPSIATDEELHTANSLTQTTQWTTLAVGAFLGGTSVMQFGYNWAFVGNSLSFVFSALCISRLFLPGRGFRPPRRDLNETDVVRPWHEYVEGLRYMRSVPLILGLAMVNVGWATGGGAAQILFTVFGEMVFNRGPYGLGLIWGCAGVGLVCGGGLAYAFSRRLSFAQYKRAVVVCYIVHGGAYVLFSQVKSFMGASLYLAFARGGGRQFGDEHGAAPAPRSRPVPRPGVRHHGNHRLVGDDDLHAPGRRGLAVLGPAHHRHHRGRAQFHARRSTGDGPTLPAACRSLQRRRGAGRDRNSRRANV